MPDVYCFNFPPLCCGIKGFRPMTFTSQLLTESLSSLQYIWKWNSLWLRDGILNKSMVSKKHSTFNDVAAYSHHTLHVGSHIKIHVLLRLRNQCIQLVVWTHTVKIWFESFFARWRVLENVHWFFIQSPVTEQCLAKMTGFRECSLVLHTMPCNKTMSC